MKKLVQIVFSALIITILSFTAYPPLFAIAVEIIVAPVVVSPTITGGTLTNTAIGGVTASGVPTLTSQACLSTSTTSCSWTSVGSVSGVADSFTTITGAATDNASLAAELALRNLKSANLSDVASAALARDNLGLGTAATTAATAYDPAGTGTTAVASAVAVSAQRASNLSDLANAATARTNLGLGTAATTAATDYLPVAGNAATATLAATATALAADPADCAAGSFPLGINAAGSAVGCTVAVTSPLTTKGDIAGFSTVPARIPVGANGTSLVADSTVALGVKWAAPAGGGDALTSATLAQFAATTSAQLAGVLSNETGSGLAVFATSPSLTTATLGGVTTVNTEGDTLKTGLDPSYMREGSCAVCSSGDMFTVAGEAVMHYWSHNFTHTVSGTVSTFGPRDENGVSELWVLTESGKLKYYSVATGNAGVAPTTGNFTLTETHDLGNGGGHAFFNAVDATGAISTAPVKAGLVASIPGTCTVGMVYFATNATAGQNMYYCTATNTWTQQLNSGGGDMVLASVQSVTGKKTFDSSAIAVKGSSTGVTTFASANASANNYTQTFPAVTGTVLTTGTGTITSAELAGSLTDETGTGAAVFGTAPTITLANGTGLPLTTGVTGLLPAVNGGVQCHDATGTDTITATFSPAVTLTDKLQVCLRSAGANTTTSVTFNPNGLGATPITHHGGSAMHAADMPTAGGVVLLTYHTSGTPGWEITGDVPDLETLSDVDLTALTAGQALIWNGSAFTNQSLEQSGGGGAVTYYNATPVTAATSTANVVALATLSTTPIVTAEQTVTSAAANAAGFCTAGVPCAFAAWLDGVLGRTSITAGSWIFNSYVSVDAATGTTSLTRGVYSVLSQDGGSVTITTSGCAGIAPARTCTATASGGTPFALNAAATVDACAADVACKTWASATNIDASMLSTSLGLWKVSARASDTVVTINVPDGYTGESAVAFKVWKRLFNSATGDINDLTAALQSFQTVQPAYPVTVLHELGAVSFASLNTTARTLTIYYNGTTHNTRFETPLNTLHDSLAGLSGCGANCWHSALAGTSANTVSTPVVRGASGEVSMGALTATSINGNTITTGTGTLTLGAGSSLVTSATNSITLTSTGATDVTLPTTGTLATTAGTVATATNLAGGSGGTIPYQSAAGTTAMLANGTAGQVLQSNGTTLAPSWVAAGAGDMILASVQTVTGAKTFGSAGAVGKLLVAGNTSGAVTIAAPAVASTYTATLPAATDTLVGLATADTMTNKTLTTPAVNGYTEGVCTPTVTAGAVTLDVTTCTFQKVVTAANTTITLPSAAAGKSYTVQVCYGGTHTITWAGGGTLAWPAATAPTATSVNAKCDLYIFTSHGATYTFGVDGGRNFAGS